jgi:hypothetical protein
VHNEAKKGEGNDDEVEEKKPKKTKAITKKKEVKAGLKGISEKRTETVTQNPPRLLRSNSKGKI